MEVAENPDNVAHVPEVLLRYAVVPQVRGNKKRNRALVTIGAALALVTVSLIQSHLVPRITPALGVTSRAMLIPPPTITASSNSMPTFIGLGAAANYRIDWLTAPPSGLVNLGGDSFIINPYAIYQSAHESLPEQANTATIPILDRLGAPHSVKVLVSGAYVSESLRGKKIGEIVLNFSDGNHLITPLIALKNIRENWYYVGQVPAIESKCVYIELQKRGGSNAVGLLDELSIQVPLKERSKHITSITIRDTSLETAGSLNPSIQVSGVAFSWD